MSLSTGTPMYNVHCPQLSDYNNSDKASGYSDRLVARIITFNWHNYSLYIYCKRDLESMIYITLPVWLKNGKENIVKLTAPTAQKHASFVRNN